MQPVRSMAAPRNASELVAAARERLADELASLPRDPTPAGLRRLLSALASPTISRGAIVHLIRASQASGDGWAARELFVLLLERCERANDAWVRRVMRQSPAAGADMAGIGEELRQELALALWAEVGLARQETWELFFARALDFAQRHTASAYMERRGLWRRPGATGGRAELARLLVSMSRLRWEETQRGEAVIVRDPRNPFRAAELADLRALVSRLPERQRAVIVMRYWQGASEDEMSRALGVTPRKVCNLRHAAYKRLRAWYLGESDASEREGATTDDT